MEWYIEKGQTVSSTEPILMDFYRTFPSGVDKISTSSLIVCDDNVAPSYFPKSKKSTARVLCSLVADLNDVPARYWKTKRSGHDGSTYQQIDYKLGMQLSSGGLKFDLKIDGVSYGNVTASFD